MANYTHTHTVCDVECSEVVRNAIAFFCLSTPNTVGPTTTHLISWEHGSPTFYVCHSLPTHSGGLKADDQDAAHWRAWNLTKLRGRISSVFPVWS